MTRCPFCGKRMCVAGSRKRIVRLSDGRIIYLIIRRLYCDRCDRMHHELPDLVVPYKRYSSDAVEKLLSSRTSPVSVGCETSTVLRLRVWFSLLRSYFESALESIKLIFKNDTWLAAELNQLLPLSPESLPDGWLAKLVRTVVNSGFWIQTRSACTV